MYAIRRLIEPVCNIVHTDDMYYVKPYFPSSSNKAAEEFDEIGRNLSDRLSILDATVSHLLELFQQTKKCPTKPKATSVKPTQSHPVAPTIPPQRLTIAPVTVVVQANPDHPPLSALLYCHLLALHGANISLFSYIHSTVSNMPKELLQLIKSIPSVAHSKSPGCLCIRIVWTRQCPDCVTFTDIQSPFLYGESMLIQRLLSLTESDASPKLSELLVKIELGLMFNPDLRETTMSQLRSHPYLTKGSRSTASALDCFLYVCARRLNILDSLPSNWRKMCASFQSLPSLNTFFAKK
ncbi:hypothetical protein FGIG_08882 [Fasciola gigantica]|uniref:AIMP2 thioredoxin-like domain-containing protein n=1 Tax=Fasciola gigantica TaxID=46835 RepID=A0A504YU35_FASGI|nr:hypothetical protein FGIG_08882 [Fasciola gigantica]